MTEVNGRTVRLVLEPGTPWEDAYEGIEKFKTELPMLREQLVEEQAKRDSETASAETTTA